jgi:hypothetical protein
MIYRILPFLRPKASNSISDDCNCKHILYDYVLWNNTIEGVWYAIHRDYYINFFAGGKSRNDVAIANKFVVANDLSQVVEKLIKLYEKQR